MRVLNIPLLQAGACTSARQAHVALRRSCVGYNLAKVSAGAEHANKTFRLAANCLVCASTLCAS